MILDTSFLIELMNGNPDAIQVAEDIEDQNRTQRIPAQVVYELYVGVGYTDTPATERERTRAVIDSRPVVETTAEIARTAGRIDGQLRREGHRLPPNDVIIGATARQYDEPVVTANPSDFERIPDIEVKSVTVP
jgi:predicted nucleic acid-binding protein